MKRKNYINHYIINIDFMVIDLKIINNLYNNINIKILIMKICHLMKNKLLNLISSKTQNRIILEKLIIVILDLIIKVF